jgi:hypothetical protein
MTTPLSMESAVGYVVAEDVYIAYSEYYGDGTIYGRVGLLDVNNREPVKGAGKSKKELVEAGVVLSETVIGSINGELVVIPDLNEPVVEEAVVEEAVVEEVVVEEAVVEEAVVEEAVVEEAVVEEAVVEEAVVEEVVVEEVSPDSGLYTVSMVIAGFTVSRELNVKIDEESHHIYLSD